MWGGGELAAEGGRNVSGQCASREFRKPQTTRALHRNTGKLVGIVGYTKRLSRLNARISVGREPSHTGVFALVRSFSGDPLKNIGGMLNHTKEGNLVSSYLPLKEEGRG